MTAPLIPRHVMLEVMRGCNAKCVMCPLVSRTDDLEVPVARMDDGDFAEIVEKFRPYAAQIEFVSLFGLGEPLLDRGIVQKVAHMKALGFRSLAFATNAALLDAATQDGLLRAGIDTLICSVDGADKATHESIRVNTNYDEVVANVRACVGRRNAGGYRTRFLLRMIRMTTNHDQWPTYVDYWKQVLDPAKGDDIVAFDVLNEEELKAQPRAVIDYTVRCPEIHERMIVDYDGQVTLCCGDMQGRKNRLPLGNVLVDDPVEIFNRPAFRFHREMDALGLRGHLALCRTCSVPEEKQRKVSTSFADERRAAMVEAT